ncbi:hypothetical protein Celaphus_00007619 [Cervus elaphus hippelaphus]|uniref:Uncharacterized protein n=1 Tax=Cervus elaphus hippelaphus TaxID=46360 RepID=A0A212CBK0_CEREH|nr:hypothetical protein Celaphus_00007619 [Cervus elaphus hippelaphus]
METGKETESKAQKQVVGGNGTTITVLSGSPVVLAARLTAWVQLQEPLRWRAASWGTKCSPTDERHGRKSESETLKRVRLCNGLSSSREASRLIPEGQSSTQGGVQKTPTPGLFHCTFWQLK